ncbi:hypothetical protein A2Z56_04450 [Candidatus Kaiserbacteria bacterium RIFCSPHIGHO2_12_45_16]|nr:MAG: hypothetical protein A2Z56_04450 [Candidatus Kaiserbacteria bacterium RIFCSPHIGHO2_12_45_16]
MFFPPINGLVIFTPNQGHGHHGVICHTERDLVFIYGFHQGKTFEVKSGSYLPFTKDNYREMCDQNYWPGLKVMAPNQHIYTVTDGRRDAFRFDYEITTDFFVPFTSYQPWLPLRWFTPCGHAKDGFH